MCSVSSSRACSCRVYVPASLRARRLEVGREGCTRKTLDVLSRAELWFEEEVGLGPKQRGTLAGVVGMDPKGPPPWEQM